MDSPFPTPEDLAIVLGLIRGNSVFCSTTGTKTAPTEHVRILSDVKACLTQWATALSIPEEDTLLSKFCASYFPELINHWVKHTMLPSSEGSAPPEYCSLMNGYLWVLSTTYHLPYFTKYFRSTKALAAPGKDFASLLAHKIIAFGMLNRHIPIESPLGDGVEEYVLDPAFWALNILQKVLIVSPKQGKNQRMLDLPPDLVIGLLPHLLHWKMQRGYEPLANASEKLYRYLTDEYSYRGHLRRKRKVWKGSTKCALPGCEEINNLKACARCLTVYYVSCPLVKQMRLTLI
ncbi:hypothetical protein BDN72DRAFT_120932 [Pluteus cervinus]|uniref:Uncharacterized protein n=1 Tax=Pluteus cervinus TaxID=181527 RepID=A0ACD3B6S6_9AGAR|nr:hypothetical protein BDN72DRAFT_120932 [Pluteus cervinus]